MQPCAMRDVVVTVGQIVKATLAIAIAKACNRAVESWRRFIQAVFFFVVNRSDSMIHH